MGTAASSIEATQPPGKTSHKLSKPRVGRHDPPAAGLLSSDGCLARNTARRPNSHDSGGGLPTRPSTSARPPPSSPPISRLASLDLEVDFSDDLPRRHLDSAVEARSNGSLLASEPSPSRPRERRRRASTGITSSRELGCVRRVQSVASLSPGPTHHASPAAQRFARSNSRFNPNARFEKGANMVMLRSRSWRTSVEDPSPADDSGAYQPPPRLSHPESVNMPDYDIVDHESKYAILENTWKSSHPTPSPTSPRIFRVSSDISLYAPVRRRSMIRTPGIATRSPSTSDLARHSSSNLASTARHSRNTSFDSGPEVLSVLPILPEPGQQRAVTPTKFDYRQLGTMEFGSLRITNGGPSPSNDRKQGPKGSREEKFEPRDEAESSLDAKPKEETATGPTIVEPRPISAAISPITATFLKLESADPGPLSTSPKDEQEELGSFLPGLNFGSFSLMGPKSPSSGLQTTSKHTALEDKLFEEETPSNTSQHDSTGSNDTIDIQSRAGDGKTDAISKAQTITRPDSGFISSPTSETSHKPFSKTDSGYSSNVSLRSLRDSKGPPTDKELPPCPGEPSDLSAADRSSSATSFLGDLRLPSPRPISLESPSAPAPSGTGAVPPPPPPKDIRPVAASATPPAVTKSASIPLLNASFLRTTAKKKTGHRPSFLSMTRNKTSGPGSPNSIPLSPALSTVSSSATPHQAGVRKPGPLKRLLSATSRKGSRSSLGSFSFRQSGSSSTSRESASTPIPFFTKLSKDSRRGTSSGLSAMESAYCEESSEVAPESPEEGTLRRHRSLQSIPATIVNAAASVLPSRKTLRRSMSTSIEETYDDEFEDDMTEVNEEWSRASSSEGDMVSPEDYTRDSLMRNGFDPSFMAMTSARDAYFSPAPSRAPSRAHSRAGSVASPSVDTRLAELYARSNSDSPVSFDTGSPHSTSIPEHPYMSSSHPLTRAQSVVQLRIPAPLRPHSTPSPLHKSQSQTFSMERGREFTYSYPPTASWDRSSPENTVSSQEAQRRHQRRSTTSSRENDDSVSLNGLEKLNFPPRGPGSHHSRTNSVSSQGSSIGVYVRSLSANPYSEQQRKMPGRPSSATPHSRQGPPLRHRASYEGQASKSKLGPAYRRQSPNLWTSTHYEQLQMQYGGTAFDPRAGWYPPYVPRSGHYRNRSTASQGRSNAPYRVLHSYYSPAYRHVPIWG